MANPIVRRAKRPGDPVRGEVCPRDDLPVRGARSASRRYKIEIKPRNEIFFVRGPGNLPRAHQKCRTDPRLSARPHGIRRPGRKGYASQSRFSSLFAWS